MRPFRRELPDDLGGLVARSAEGRSDLRSELGARSWTTFGARGADCHGTDVGVRVTPQLGLLTKIRARRSERGPNLRLERRVWGIFRLLWTSRRSRATPDRQLTPNSARSTGGKEGGAGGPRGALALHASVVLGGLLVTLTNAAEGFRRAAGGVAPEERAFLLLVLVAIGLAAWSVSGVSGGSARYGGVGSPARSPEHGSYEFPGRGLDSAK